MDEKELVAKFEAHLRGVEIVFVDLGHSSAKLWMLQRDTRPGALPVVPTPHDTAEGREWWCERLKLAVLPGVPTPSFPNGIWIADDTYYQAELEDSVYTRPIHHYSESRSEAITNAILAAARQWQEQQ